MKKSLSRTEVSPLSPIFFVLYVNNFGCVEVYLKKKLVSFLLFNFDKVTLW